MIYVIMALQVLEIRNFLFMDRLTVRIRKIKVCPNRTPEAITAAWLYLESDLLDGIKGDDEVTFLFRCEGKYSSLEQYARYRDSLETQYRHWTEVDKTKPFEILMFHCPSLKDEVKNDPTLCE